MPILDDYSQNAADEGSQKADPARLDSRLDPAERAARLADARKKRAELEQRIVIVNSDLKRVIREKQDLEANQRRLRKDEERIRVERDALDEKIKKASEQERQLEEEVAGLKKKLKMLT